jgi:hypothetical protein
MALGDATSTRLISSLSRFRKKNKALTCALVAEQSRTSPESRGSTAALDRVPIGWEGRKRGEGGGEKTIGEKRQPRESAPEHSTKLFEALFRRNTPLPLKRLPRKPLTLCSSLASRDVPAPPLARPRRPTFCSLSFFSRRKVETARAFCDCAFFPPFFPLFFAKVFSYYSSTAAAPEKPKASPLA